MGKGGAKTTAVEVDDGFVLAQWEDDARVEGIRALRVEQAELPQKIEGIASNREVTA
jgi:hypothetical protein